MIKKLLFIVGIFFLLPAYASAEDFTERVKIDSTPATLTHLITRPNQQQWLIRVAVGCDSPLVSDQAELVIRGTLNGHEDYLKTSALHKCAIKQADRINTVYDVMLVYPSNTVALIKDDQNKRYRVFYGEKCAALQGFDQGKVYGFRRSTGLTKTDKIYIPGSSQICTFYTVTPLKDPAKPAQTSKDIQKPSTVTDVKAVPGRTKAFVYWDKAQDNVEVSYYWVRTLKYKVRPESLSLKLTAKDLKTSNNHATVTNLETDELYFFYVLAMDSSGNVSSRWSEPGTGETRSTILEP